MANVGTKAFQYAVVYDPSGGFVTGGGWINSPPGAFYPGVEEFLSVVGRANFGFVSKYQKGAKVPTGNTEFQFKAGDLSFNSSSYQWLVVGGAQAQFKGEGMVNNLAGFGFLLTAVDGSLLGNGQADRFRIKLWDKVSGTIIYNNQPRDGTASLDFEGSTLQGGNIVIHK